MIPDNYEIVDCPECDGTGKGFLEMEGHDVCHVCKGGKGIAMEKSNVIKFPHSKYDFEFNRQCIDEEGGYLVPPGFHYDFMVFLFASKFPNHSLDFINNKRALKTIYYFLTGETQWKQ